MVGRLAGWKVRGDVGVWGSQVPSNKLSYGIANCRGLPPGLKRAKQDHCTAGCVLQSGDREQDLGVIINKQLDAHLL